MRNAHHVEIENSQIEDVGEVAISVSDTNLCLVHDNEISNCSIAAIESYNGSNVIVKSNKIMNIEKNVFIAFTGGQIKAEKNEIKDVKESMVKLAENSGGEFVDNQISNCPKQAEIDQNASLFFLCGNGNFTNETNDESRINESVMLKKMDKSDNSMCMNCHKNKRDCFFDLCLHKIYCKECAEQLIKDKKGCPLCRCQVSEIINGITIDDEKTCIICYDKKVDSILIPCGHIIACSDCLENWMKTKKECPICRKEISNYKKIHNFE